MEPREAAVVTGHPHVAASFEATAVRARRLFSLAYLFPCRFAADDFPCVGIADSNKDG